MAEWSIGQPDPYFREGQDRRLKCHPDRGWCQRCQSIGHEQGATPSSAALQRTSSIRLPDAERLKPMLNTVTATIP
jgi:hypothetical protein